MNCVIAMTNLPPEIEWTNERAVNFASLLLFSCPSKFRLSRAARITIHITPKPVTENVSSRLMSNYTNASARVPKGALFFLHILSSQSSSLSIFQMYFGAYVVLCMRVWMSVFSSWYIRWGSKSWKSCGERFSTQTQYAHLRQMDSKCF